MQLTDKNYYTTKMLSVSTVRLFAQNPARALADFKEQVPWFENSNALLIGGLFHFMLEKAVALVQRSEAPNVQMARKDAMDMTLTKLMSKLTDDPQYQVLFTRNGKFRAEPSRIPEWFKVIWQSEPMTPVITTAYNHAHGQDDLQYVLTEVPLQSTLRGIPYKGKPDLLVINIAQKVITAYDYKTSHPFAPYGMDYVTDIYGNRNYMNVAWSREKLFPWQAGVYRQLLWDNGYADYKIHYHYLVITKELVPRLTVFNITSSAMDQGFAEFTQALIQANEYIKTQRAPLIQDGSAFANRATYQKPIRITVKPRKK